MRNPLGCNMSFRRCVFEEAGYFKGYLGRVGKRLLDAEEAEFSIRVLRKIPRSRIIYDPSAIVYHKVSMNRKTVGYLTKRSFYQGLSKGLLEKSESNSPRTLSLERGYLKYLIGDAIVARLKQAHNPDNLSQLTILILSTLLVLAGYVAGSLITILGWSGKESPHE